ncbi:transcriptional repressor LexA [Corynebacterium sp. ES2794-CONJ1]|uniref:transcriptional repressor LexA n=1 Tax=unclassified Corynebacterium TaxID=2624378 RepID=UPI00216A9248|nr:MULTISPECIES: transcriptional repressor LexA [unclassified Corynebacterium]MCS4489175.1 transcriptional repressor LexA [Corynebacterium sp. ES2775-CONJ]MCS4490988.1 transcriptional repressor LexA [Corynebacterium sp. ES2715-CONJ3]MCS4531131.1 transcriptional repressor LexA [Corynebacterium sp. ES2730-CONJ]MCU9518498.1 transcriptional repressor LexA [Corynebacterium sp. ES2794-CONJ1]
MASKKTSDATKISGTLAREKLSKRQETILQVINDALVLRGYPPSIREIGDATGLQSTSSVAYQLRELERKGYIKRDANKPRAVDIKVNLSPQRTAAKKDSQPISVQDESDRAHTSYIPLVGAIAAGNPILAEENIDTYYPVPKDFVGDGDLFMLQVVGESMQDAGILDGDYIIIRSQPVANNGEFVAAMIDGEATVKEFRKDRTGIWLLPHNPVFDPIPATPETEILGKVVSVFRTF